MYYVSVIIQDPCDKRAWRCSTYDGWEDYESARFLVEKYRSTHTVLAAWVTDEASHEVRFFECYVDISGQVQEPQRQKTIVKS